MCAVTSWGKGLAPGQAAPVGHVSLLEMINETVGLLCEVIATLREKERGLQPNVLADRMAQAAKMFGQRLPDNFPEIGPTIPPDEKSWIASWLEAAETVANRWEMTSVPNRVHLFRIALRSDVLWPQYVAEIRALRETLEAEVQQVRIYRYPADKTSFILKWRIAWEVTLGAFPEIKDEIEAGVDCYAMGHNTACVFHMMRVAEAGLRAVADLVSVTELKNKNKPIEWGTWKEVLDAISAKLALVQNATAGPMKDADRAFYNGVDRDIRALQDCYRDKAMHLRDSFNDGEAQSAMIHVRELTERVAVRRANLGDAP